MIINQPIVNMVKNTMTKNAQTQWKWTLIFTRHIRCWRFGSVTSSKMAEKTQICFQKIEREIKLQNVKKYQIASIYEVDNGSGRSSLQGTSAAGDLAQ